MKKLLMIFIDGVGLGNRQSPHNPIKKEKCPFLYDIIFHRSSGIDPVMGVKGIPQSATGQTSLLCGINAQKIMNSHIEGFPTKKLRELIKKENIFKKLKSINTVSTFANGYILDDPSKIDEKLKKMISVTTIASMSGLGYVRPLEALVQGKAVYQDITQEITRQRGADLPTITPTEAAQRLFHIMDEADFTLFEYFQTDVAGHKQDQKRIDQVLLHLEDFLAHLHTLFDFSVNALIITSDHGNIEDLSTPLHTKNPVPFYVKGFQREMLADKVKNLADITPAIVDWFSASL
jgi:hypothetical protein